VSPRKRWSWARSFRIRKRREFVAAQSCGRKLHGRHFLVIVASGPSEDGHGRLGITVSKRVGNAVTRNRIKRWVREYVRQAPATSWLPTGRDVVVIAKASAARIRDYSEVARDLDALGERL